VDVHGEDDRGDPVADDGSVWGRDRLRTIAMIVVFDVGGPLLTFVLLRSAGLSAVLSLVLSGILPAFGVGLNAIHYRRLDVFGVLVLAGIVIGSVLGLITHSARLYLVEGSVPSLAFSAACLGSLWMRQPLIYRIALEFLGPRTPKGREVTDAWQYPGFRRAFRIITIVWGIAYIFEAALRAVVAEIASTGIALLCSKVAPYVFAVVLSLWTLLYGEHEKRRALATKEEPVPSTTARYE
jgi:hypothetical protein